MSELGRKLHIIDGWRFAAGVAFVAVIVLLLFDLKLWIDLNNVVKARTIEAQASNHRSVDQCFSSAANAPALIRVLDALHGLPLDAQAKQDLLGFKRVSTANSPTLRECKHLAATLGVEVPKDIVEGGGP